MSSGQKPLRAAVIGAGQIARQHLACLRELPIAEVVAIVDRSPSSAQAAAEEFAVPATYTDHQRMLAEVYPDVVHIATPVTSHYYLADAALEAKAHVFLEKPATPDYAQTEALIGKAERSNLTVIEDYNYLFNRPILQLAQMIDEGTLGELTHLEVGMYLDILSPDSPYGDPNAPHVSQSMAGGPISDFLTHLAAFSCFFLGPHHDVKTLWKLREPATGFPFDEFRGLVDAERGTAMLTFSAHTQPDAFSLRLYGTRMRAKVNLFENRLTTEVCYPGLRPLTPFRNALRESKLVRNSAWRSLWSKLSGGPGTYHGLWALVARAYQSLLSGESPPVTLQQIAQVNQLVEALKPNEVDR